MQNIELLIPVLARIDRLVPGMAVDPVIRQSLLDNVMSMIADAHDRYAAEDATSVVSDEMLADEHLATGALHAERLLHPAGPMVAAEILFDEYLPTFVDEVGATTPSQVLRASRALHAGIWHRFPAGAIAYTEALRQRVTTAHLDSRAQVARDLHDRVAHAVLAGVQRVEMVALTGTGSATGTTARQHLQEATRLLRAALVDVQDLAVSLHARVGSDDLGTAIERHAFDLFACDRDLVVETHGTPRALVNWRAEEALTIVMEALTNWRKPAAGSPAKVVCAWRRDDVRVTVEDDGPGFDPTTVCAGRLGQATMRDRAALIGAPLVIDSVPGDGTTVRLTIPYGAH